MENFENQETTKKLQCMEYLIDCNEFDDSKLAFRIGALAKSILGEELEKKSVYGKNVLETLIVLTDIEYKVISLLYGLETEELKTIEKVAYECNTVVEEIEKIEERALKKLRHPHAFAHMTKKKIY